MGQQVEPVMDWIGLRKIKIGSIGQQKIEKENGPTKE